MPLQVTRNPEHLSMSRVQIVPNKSGSEGMDKTLRDWSLRDRLCLSKMPSEEKSSLVFCENGSNYDPGHIHRCSRFCVSQSTQKPQESTRIGMRAVSISIKSTYLHQVSTGFNHRSDPLEAEGRGFKSLRPDHYQLIETEPLKPYPLCIQQPGCILYRSLLSINSLL
jgi:hypothetical protein